MSIVSDGFSRGVKKLGARDFWLGTAMPTALQSRETHIILFFNPQAPSFQQGYKEIWMRLADNIAGVTIASVNVVVQEDIMKAFIAVASDIDNPLNQFSGFGVPTIIVYRNRWPQAYYNGEISYGAISKWITALAVKPGYHEKQLLIDGLELIDPDQYVDQTRLQNFAYPTSSQSYTSTIGEVGGQQPAIAVAELDEDGNQILEVDPTEDDDSGFIPPE